MNVLVVGGGLVGSAAALGLVAQGYTVTLLEAQAPQVQTGQYGVDIRNVALNPQSQSLLQELGVWHDDSAVAYHGMHVWEERGTQHLDFSAEPMGLAALGWLVESSPLTQRLFAACEAQLSVKLGEVDRVEVDADQVRVVTQSGDVLESDFLVGADGANSQVRQSLGVEVRQYPVHQAALATVKFLMRKICTF